MKRIQLITSNLNKAGEYNRYAKDLGVFYRFRDEEYQGAGDTQRGFGLGVTRKDRVCRAAYISPISYRGHHFSYRKIQQLAGNERQIHD